MNDFEFQEIRELLRFTKAQLAEFLGVKEKSVDVWEVGRNPIPHEISFVLKSISQAKITKIDLIGNNAVSARTFNEAPQHRIVFNLRISDYINSIVEIGGFKYEGEFFRILTAENRGTYLHI